MGDVLSKSVGILSERPSIILPQVIPVIPALFTYLAPNSSSLGLLTTITSIVAAVLSIIVSGAYPYIVKAVLGGEQYSMTDALGRAYHKFWTLLGAGILVGLIVILGGIALIVPGVIFATWYAYTVPAIMLGDKGALEGMSTSKAFGRDKKWSTFLIILTVGIAGVAVYAVGIALRLFSPLAGSLAYRLLAIPVAAWGSVVIAYTYISYGPSSVAVTPPTSAPGQAVMQPAVTAVAGKPSYCPKCGTKLAGDEVFCMNCGTRLQQLSHENTNELMTGVSETTDTISHVPIPRRTISGSEGIYQGQKRQR